MDTATNGEINQYIFKYFSNKNVPRQVLVDLLARIELLAAKHVGDTIYNAHTSAEMRAFRKYIDTKDIKDEVRISRILANSYEAKTGKSTQALVTEFIQNFFKDVKAVEEFIDSATLNSNLATT